MSTSHITTVKSPGNYRNLATLHCCACMRALQRSPGFIYLCLFVCFVTCSAVPFCCSFLLGLQHFELPRFFFVSCARCYSLLFFFSHKRKTTGNRSPSSILPSNVFRLQTHSKIRLCKTPFWNSCLHHHTIYPPTSLSSSFGLFFFCLCFFPSIPDHDFFLTMKKKICLIRISIYSFCGQLPDLSIMCLSISFRL